MKTVRTFVLLFFVAILICPDVAEAQIWKRIKERAKERTEDRIEQRADKAVDKSIDKAEEGVEEAVKSMVSSEGEEAAERQRRELKLGPNATAPVDAPIIQYRSTTSLDMPGLGVLTRILGKDFARGVTETVTLTADHQRTDQEDQSTIIDLENERHITLDHKNKRYAVTTFEEMMNMAESAAASAGEAPSAGEISEELNTEIEYDFDVETRHTGQTAPVNGTDAEQLLFIVETQFDASTTDDEGRPANVRGKFYAVTDMWISREVAGYETMQAFNRQMAEVMGRHFTQEELATALQTAGQDPRLGASLEKAAEEMQEVEGLPIRSTMYFVLVPEDKKLNIELAMASQEEGEDGMAGLSQMAQSMSSANGNSELEEQVTIMSITTQISDLKTEGIDTSFEIPADYTEVDQP